MVSTRTPKNRLFEKGERVLCYEPDPTKAKVLYDSKVLGTYEARDKRGRRQLQYKIHFQGWSSSWDRKVNANFVLKDTAENRQLQKDLADKAQLQIGAYLYRRERSSSSSKKRSRKQPASEDTSSGGGGAAGGGGSVASGAETNSPKLRNRGSSEDNYSSGSTFEKNEADFVMRDDCETESYCSSIESALQDEERVQLRLSERLRLYLEYDYDMTVKQCKQHVLPARVPVIAILENFVKQTAVKMVFSATQAETTSRRRSTLQRTDKKEREFDNLLRTVALMKEVADGLRIYFDFTISDYLLYKEEKEYALSLLTEENLMNFTYVAAPGMSSDFLNAKTTESEPSTSATIDNSQDLTTPSYAASVISVSSTVNESIDEPQKRKLRSHRSDDGDVLLENCFSSIASTSSGGSTPLHPNVPPCSSNFNLALKYQPMAVSIPPQTKDFLQKVLAWRILPTNAAPAPSMIFGAPHLARLIVKLPDFLNATTMNDEKLKVLLQHLDKFTNFLESRKEWFTEENYTKTVITKTLEEEEQDLEAPSELTEATETNSAADKIINDASSTTTQSVTC